MNARFVFLSALALGLFGFLTTAKVWALSEACPAQVQRVSPADTSSSDPATRYVYELQAISPRSVNATVIADTSGGWYTWDVSAVPLTAVTRYTQFNSYSDAASAPLGVVFPSAVVIHHAWVARAKSSGEEVMGWDAQGTHQCALPAFVKGGITADTITLFQGYPLPKTVPTPKPLSTPALFAKPVVTASPFPIGNCPTRFAPVTVEKPIPPGYPRDVHIKVTVVVDVTVDATGQVVDATVRAPSSYKSADMYAAQAAYASKYSPGVSYCQPVGGHYIFQADFNPGY